MKSKIQEKPVQSSVLAFGLGFLMGVWLHRGSAPQEKENRQDAA